MKGLCLVVLSLMLGCSTVDKYELVLSQADEYQVIIELPGVSRGVLISRSKEWFDQSFGGYSVDDDKGNLTGMGFSEVVHGTKLNDVRLHYEFLVRVDTKDGKARIRLSDVSGTARMNTDSTPYYPPTVKDVLDPVMASYEKYILTGWQETVDADW